MIREHIYQRVRFSFDAAHFLPDYNGPCANMHGHTWRGEVTISSPVDETTGMAHDFKWLKQAIDSILPDHTSLNDVLPIPTCEQLAKYLMHCINAELPQGTRVAELTLWESDRCGITVRGSHYEPEWNPWTSE